VNKKNKPARRLSQQQWLQLSLEAFAGSPTPDFNIDELVSKLGVTKGSFYHHFLDKNDFIDALVKYWDDKYTRDIGAAILDSDHSPEDMLWDLMLAIDESIAGVQFEMTARAWGAVLPEVSKILKRTDKFRIRAVKSIFAEMGFEDEELEARTLTFVYTFSFQAGLTFELPKPRREEVFRSMHRFLTRK